MRAGADEVKTAACGGFTASLSNLTHILAARGSVCDATCGVRLTELQRAVDQLRWMCETGRSKTSAFDNDLSEEQAERGELELTIRDDLSTVLAAAARLGYDLSEEDGPKVYEAFTRIAGMNAAGKILKYKMREDAVRRLQDRAGGGTRETKNGRESQ